MQFLYCPDCKQVQPRRWYASKRCASCGGEAIIFKVRTGPLGYLAIVTSIVSLVLAGLYLANYDTPLGESIVYAFLLFVASYPSYSCSSSWEEHRRSQRRWPGTH